MEQVYVARAARARRRRRRRVLAMSVFSLCTIAALVAVVWVVVRLDRLHAISVTATPAAMTRGWVAAPRLTDVSAQVSYDLLGPPWQKGCPASLSTGAFAWTAGEAAIAGQVDDTTTGQPVTWYGSACSGPLPGSLRGAGLRAAATAVLGEVGPVYYGALPHTMRVLASQQIRAGGSAAWRILFRVQYSGPHLPWSGERGAVVVVNRGGGELYYVSVPDNLASWTYQALVASLR